MSVRILIGDCREKLREMPDASVNCCITSPPYFGLRDYGVDGQMGLEPTPDEFVAGMVEVFREVRRVLRDDGTLWLNIGDSYNANQGAGFDTNKDGGERKRVAASPKRSSGGLAPKQLLGVPWRLAFALQADGWFLRQDIIWSKPNPMPESVRDRCTKAHEYLFLLSKGPKYYFDAEAIAEPLAPASIERLSQVNIANQAGSDRVPGKTNGTMKAVSKYREEDGSLKAGFETKGGTSGDLDGTLLRMGEKGTRNKRSVWTVPTQPYSEAHFATYPPALIEPCILAGCPQQVCAKCGAPWMRESAVRGGGTIRAGGDVYTGQAYTSPQSAPRGPKKNFGSSGLANVSFVQDCGCASDAGTITGTVLDPFFGAGTTGLVADRLQRDCIGIELNPEYAEIAQRRLNGDGGMFSEVLAA